MANDSPTRQDVEQCYTRLLNAGGMIPIGRDCFLEEDYSVSTIERVATFIVVDECCYWKVKPSPNFEGCLEETQIEIDYDELPFWLQD